jgi:hypothetical protein
MLEEVEAEPRSRGNDELVLLFVIRGLSLTDEPNQLGPRLVEANLQSHAHSVSTSQPAIRRPTCEQHWATNQDPVSPLPESTYQPHALLQN